jgi:hypothetical protein
MPASPAGAPLELDLDFGMARSKGGQLSRKTLGDVAVGGNAEFAARTGGGSVGGVGAEQLCPTLQQPLRSPVDRFARGGEARRCAAFALEQHGAQQRFQGAHV